MENEKDRKKFVNPEIEVLEFNNEFICLAPSPGTFKGGLKIVDFDNDEFVF